MSETRTLLKREETIAVHALIDMATHPGTSAAEIAERLALPKAYTAKVLGRLAACGLVESRPGRRGGVWLRAALSELTVLSVVEALSGAVQVAACGSADTGPEPRSPCELHAAYRRLGKRIRAALGAMRLADMAGADPSRGHRSQAQSPGTESA